jgi:acetyl esterase
MEEVEGEQRQDSAGVWAALFAYRWIAWPLAWLLQRAGGLLTRPVRALRFPELVLRTQALRIPTRHGSIRARAYFPDCGGSELPGVYVNFHGGGYVLRHPQQDDPLCRFLAQHARAVVVNVDYDVAPQCPFPIPTDQATDALAWVAAQGARLGWDARRIAVGGQSAGGALAAAAARAARDAGAPEVALQVLHYAPLDLVSGRAPRHVPGHKPVLGVGVSALFDASYTPDPASRLDMRVSPAYPANLRDLAGLPPALVVTAELDLVRDEADRYAEALARAGVPTTHFVVPSVDHFYTHRLPAQPAIQSLTRIAALLREALSAKAR